MKEYLVMKGYTTSDEYEQRPFDESCHEGSTGLDCLGYTSFCNIYSNKIPNLIIKSKAWRQGHTC